MSDLYEDDVLLWSEQQAELLHRHAAGERANDAALDWQNIIAESKVQVAASWRIFT
jgi:hypothetical protein